MRTTKLDWVLPGYTHVCYRPGRTTTGRHTAQNSKNQGTSLFGLLSEVGNAMSGVHTFGRGLIRKKNNDNRSSVEEMLRCSEEMRLNSTRLALGATFAEVAFVVRTIWPGQDTLSMPYLAHPLSLSRQVHTGHNCNEKEPSLQRHN